VSTWSTAASPSTADPSRVTPIAAERYIGQMSDGVPGWLSRNIAPRRFGSGGAVMSEVVRAQRWGATRRNITRSHRLLVMLVALATALTSVVVGLTGSTVQAAPTSTWCPDFTIAPGEVACSSSPLSLSMAPLQVGAGSTQTFTFDASLSGASNLPQPTAFALFVPAGFTRPQLTNPAAGGHASVSATGPCASASLTGVTGGGSRPWRIAGVAEGCGGQFGVRVSYTGVAPRVPSPQRFWLSTALQGIASLGSNEQVAQVVVGQPARLQVSMDATSKSAGSNWTPTVRVTDAAGNLTAANGTITLTTTDPAGSGSIHLIDGDTAVLTDGVRLVTAGTRRITATLEPGGLTGSATVTVTPGPADEIRLNLPSSVAAGTVPTGSVVVLDQFDNRATNFSGNVTVGIGGSSTTTVPVLNGQSGLDAVLQSFGTLFQMAVPVEVEASIQSIAGSMITAERTVAVRPGAAARFEVQGLVDGPAGRAQTMTVTARDQFGNVATGYRGTVSFSSTDPAAVLPPAGAVNRSRTYEPIVILGGSIPTVALNTAGPQTITVSDVVNPTISGSQTVNVGTVGGPAGFVVTGLGDAVAGTRQRVLVRAVDAQGNPLIDYTGTVVFTSTDARAALPAPLVFSPLDFGAKIGFVTLRSSGSHTVTVTDSARSLATSVSATVSPAPATRLAISGLGRGPAGVAQTVTVSALDAFGNVATGFSGTVSFTSNDPRAVLPADAAFRSEDAGVRTFPVTLRTASPTTTLADRRSVEVASAGLRSATASATVDGGLPVRIELRHGSATGPTSLSAVRGEPLAWFVVAFDVDGNRVTTWPGSVVQMSSTGPARLPVDEPLGVGARTVRLDSFGEQTLTARLIVDGTVLEASAAVQLGSGPATRLTASWVNSGGTLTVGPRTVAVTAFDAHGNVATGYRGTVTFLVEGTAADGPTSYTFTEADAGRAELVFTLQTATAASTVRLIATDSVAPALTAGTRFIRLTAGPVAGIDFELTRDRSAPPGAATELVVGRIATGTVRAVDAFGNAASTTGTVSFSSTDPQAQLPSPRSFAPTTEHVFRMATLGPQTLTATLATARGTFTDGAAVNVNDELAGIRLDAPSTVSPGVPFSVTVSTLNSDGSVFASALVRNVLMDFAVAGDPEAIAPDQVSFSGIDGSTVVPGFTLQGTATISVTFLGFEAQATVDVGVAGDAFADAIPISGASGEIVLATADATSEPFEPVDERSVWVRWTAPTTGVASFVLTCQATSNGTRRIDVSFGSTPQSLENLATEIGVCGENDPELAFSTEAGEVYSIRIASSGPTQDDDPLTLTWSEAPANDLFSSATEIFGVNGSTVGTTVGATRELDEPGVPATLQARRAADTVWYRWLSEFGFPVSFDICGLGDFGATLTVYTGSELSDLQQVASTTESCGDAAAAVFETEWQTEYWIQVDGVGSSQGEFELTWTVEFPEEEA
jgi:hypothetical protein